MRKRLFASVAVLLLGLVLAGCTTGSFNAMNYNENNGGEYWEADYELFNGYRQREITLSGDGEHAFTVDVESSAGKLALTITNSDGATLYTGNDLPTSSFTVQAFTPGKYTIRLEAENHCGSYSVKWV